MADKRSPDDFNSEIEAHIQLEADLNRERGMSDADALAAARRRFGNVFKVQVRFYESGRWLGGMPSATTFASPYGSGRIAVFHARLCWCWHWESRRVWRSLLLLMRRFCSRCHTKTRRGWSASMRA